MGVVSKQLEKVLGNLPGYLLVDTLHIAWSYLGIARDAK